MRMQRWNGFGRWQFAIIVIALLDCCLLEASAADGTQDAEAFIVGLADQAIAALTPPGISRNEAGAGARAAEG